ncbi:MAG: beta-galactosidase [Candidatus Gastranaerophilales bacterium]|nr:beta-galactosidase [Candidatus Gastranaerophilales bacterium]
MIDFDKYSIKIDDQRILVRSAALHYFRIPGANSWKDRLSKIKACGYNTVDLYFSWAYHSKEPNVYDFTDIRDIRTLLDLTVELGLYIIARPGPYINAELSAGGLPTWLFNIPDMVLRNREDGNYKYSNSFMHAVKEWYSRIIPILNEYQNIIAFQIENEYSTNEAEPDYIQELHDIARKMGIMAPIFHNDTFGACLYSDIVNIYAFDSYPTLNLSYDWRENPYQFEFLDNIESNFRECSPDSPLFVAELQAGWFDKWGGHGYDYIKEKFGRDHINIVTKTVLSQGLTMFNHFMGCGGTSWGKLASSEVYTSYDFASPISESGIPEDNYYKVKEINYFLQSFNFSSTDLIADEREILENEEEGIFAKLRQDNINNCKWLFIRNMCNERKNIKVLNKFSVSLKDFDMKILPNDLNLLGCNLDFSSFSIFSKISKSNHEIILLLLDNDSELIVSGFDDKNIPLNIGFEEYENKLKVKLIDIADNNLLKLSFSKSEKITEFIFLNESTADKTWILDNKIIIGPEFLQNNPYHAVFSKNTVLRILDLDKSNDWQVKNIEIQEKIEIPKLNNWSLFKCSPEIDPEYDFSSWNIANESLDCITNNVYDEFIWYKGKFKGHIEQIILNAKHCYAVYINGIQVFHHDSFHIDHELELSEEITFEIKQNILSKDGENDITVLVQNLGFDKGFENNPDLPRGILYFKSNPEKDIEWRIRGCLTPEIEEWDFAPTDEMDDASKNSYLVRISAEFKVDFSENIYCPMFLTFDKPKFDKALIYLNGNLIGHYWQSLGPQLKFYLIDGFLKQNNLLSLVIWNKNEDYQKIEDYKNMNNNVNINIEIIKHYNMVEVTKFI